MKHHQKAALLALLLSFAGLRPALAQDPQPTGVKPNILLIVDTSGSMEYKTGSDQFPTCDPDGPTSENERSRWVEVIEALTGSINEYSCEAVNRNSTDFAEEFAMPGSGAEEPPDFNYRNPYHRPLSYGCGYTPDRSVAPSNAFSWVAPLEAAYPIDPSSPVGCTTPFSQAGNGVVDTFSDLVRFGLMTFDPLPDDGQGFNSGSFGPNYATGVTGAWSYLAGSFASGHPANCSADELNTKMEVGARNGAAPASEGKMITFGDQFADVLDDADRHDRVQKVLLATRPYGGTPLNGALADARHFLRDDTSPDPLDPNAGTPSLADLWISPRYDEYVNCGCREQHIVLITDGEPNLDLRPYCEEAGSPDGKCPFPDDPEAILKNLYTGAAVSPPETLGASCASPGSGTSSFNDFSVRTHVVGYSAEKYFDTTAGMERDCATLQTDHPDWNETGGICASATNEDIRICCVLHKFARAGSDPDTLPDYSSGGSDPDPHDSNGLPLIAPDGPTLSQLLTNLFESLIKQSASATRPVRSPGIGAADRPSQADAPALAGFRLLTSYDTDGGTSNVWKGKVERLRWTCGGGGTAAVEQPKDVQAGDDLAYTTAKFNNQREFLTWLPDSLSYTADHLRRSLRPHVLSPGDGVTGGTVGVTRRTAAGSSFVSQIDPQALDVVNYASFAPCNGAASAAACRDRVMNWVLGFSDGEGNERCPDPNQDDCSVVGDVMHSTPVIVNRPSADIEDPTYESFALANTNRMMMGYFSSNDGFLHGYALSPNDPADSPMDDANSQYERFALIPPMLLPEIKSQYPGTRVKLLDGAPVVQDVVATNTGSSGYAYRFERDVESAAGQVGENTTWRTILVQSLGDSQSGYFALDITNANKPSSGGPEFLWQLTSTETNGQPLFGTGGTPVIATVYIEEGLEKKEVAVALLPGGKGPSPSGVTVARSDPQIGTFDNTHFQQDTMTVKLSGTVPPRDSINSYGATAARSLTIVRLDTGEIIRTFRRSSDLPASSDIDSSVITKEPEVYLDSPITGTPAVYPAGPGMIADRAFVGDQDGSMWRVDLSNPDPSKWEMKLFHDAYGGLAGDEGQPITSAPMLSVDDAGQITVAFGTGAQDLAGGPGDTHYVYSLTELEHGGKFVSGLNWYQQMTSGEHMLGPMSLLGGTLYYATYDPTQLNVCVPGLAKVYGVDYVRPEDPADLGEGGNPRLRRSRSATPGTVEEFISLSQALSEEDGSGSGGVTSVFGFSLEYTPSCYDDSAETVSYLAGGRRVSNPSTSKLQLVFQTASAVNSADSSLDFETGFAAIDLEPPQQASTILSWAAILD